jgi:hypothetical protein
MKKTFLSLLIIMAALISARPQGPNQRWMKIRSGNEIPGDAVIGGKDADGSALYVAHAVWNGNWHPGKTRKDWNSTSIEYGNQEINANDYEILIGNEGLRWVRVIQGNVPENPVLTGHENENNLYSCRGAYQGSLQVGKTWRGMDGCRIGYGGGGQVIPNYEVLVYTGPAGRPGGANSGSLEGKWILTTSSQTGCNNATFNYPEASCKDNGVSCSTLTMTGNTWSDTNGGKGTYSIMEGKTIRFSSTVDGSYSDYDYRIEGEMLTETQKQLTGCVLTVHYKRGR